MEIVMYLFETKYYSYEKMITIVHHSYSSYIILASEPGKTLKGLFMQKYNKLN